MFKVSITTTAIQTKSGISSKTGKPYEIREQPAWIFLHDEQGKPQPYPVTFMLMLERDQPADLKPVLQRTRTVKPPPFGEYLELE